VDLPPTVSALLVVAAFVAGFVDAIAGGGGLITVPALLAAGLPPHLVLGTNKGQAVWGSGAAMVRFGRAGMIDRSRAPWSFVAGFVGSALGAALVLVLSPEILRPVVLVLLVTVAFFLTVRPPLHPHPKNHSPGVARAIGMGLALGFGAYDGFFGPGTGTFLIIGAVLLLGLPLARASAEAKVVNFASNLAAFSVFAFKGVVVWHVAIPMAVSQFVGAWTGSHAAIRGGDRLVRWVVLLVVVALVAKLSWDLSS
jgi:uncharacterized membrane protein YfcA